MLRIRRVPRPAEPRVVVVLENRSGISAHHADGRNDAENQAGGHSEGEREDENGGMQRRVGHSGDLRGSSTRSARERRPSQEPVHRSPPSSESTTPSVSIWRMSRPRPAPSVVRIASSRYRPVARMRSRFATLAQAISSTTSTPTCRT